MCLRAYEVNHNLALSKHIKLNLKRIDGEDLFGVIRQAISHVFWALFFVDSCQKADDPIWIHDKHQYIAVVMVIDLLQILSHHGWHFP